MVAQFAPTCPCWPALIRQPPPPNTQSPTFARIANLGRRLPNQPLHPVTCSLISALPLTLRRRCRGLHYLRNPRPTVTVNLPLLDLSAKVHGPKPGFPQWATSTDLQSYCNLTRYLFNISLSATVPVRVQHLLSTRSIPLAGNLST